MTNEDGSFPIANSQTEFQGQLSKSTGTTSTLDISVSDFGNALFIGNTNADSMVVRVYDPDDVLYSTETITFDYQDTLMYNITGESRQGFIESFYTFDNQTESFRIEVDLTSTSTLQFGTVRAGFADHWSNPDYGWQNSSIDTSVFNTTISGADYVKNRAKIRMFSGNYLSLNNGEYFKWQDLFIKNENKNLALDFLDNTQTRQIVFGRIIEVPGYNLQSPGTVSVTLNIKEAK